MKRAPILLSAAEQAVGGHRHVFNRVTPQRDQNWFRIQNKADDDETTEVFIYDEIGFWGTTAADFIREISQITTSNIDLHLNTPGGEVFDGIAIYNALLSHPAKVTTIIDSLAASAGSFIAQAGDVIKMTRNATMMIHDGSAFCYGNAQDMEQTALILNKLSDNIADIYSQHAGGKAEEWRLAMRAESWYNADEAVDAGLADEVLDLVDENAEKAKNKWDLSIFNYAGRDEAPAPEEVKRQIMNRVKESSMSKPTNTGTPPESTPPPGEPTPGETTPQTDPAPSDPAPAAEPQGQPAGEGGEQPASPGAPENRFTPTNQGGIVSFMVNGAVVADQAAIQNHINSLEMFRKETLEGGRKQFVQNLADSKKITAKQATDLDEFVLGLTDEQYAKWCASWDAAPVHSLLASHGGDPANPTGDTSLADQKATEIDNCKGIVRQHKLAGMPVDQIQQTASFKRLKELDPTFEL